MSICPGSGLGTQSVSSVFLCDLEQIKIKIKEVYAISILIYS